MMVLVNLQRVLSKSYNSRNPIKVLETLENLKEYYLGIALKERNKKLTEGGFPEKQEPLLGKKAINLQMNC